MQIVICPGIHSAALTRGFIQAIPDFLVEALIVPAHLPAYSGAHIFAFLQQQLNQPFSQPAQIDLGQRAAALPEILLIGFSAGVVGAISAAYLWQSAGGAVAALIAVDGWGVPLVASFPVHRLSHDAFTHWSSALLGAGQTNFYAEPPVAHLDLWRAPELAQGWTVRASEYTRTDAAQFLRQCLHHYVHPCNDTDFQSNDRKNIS
jgi:pimeloyl-ACP methyl ester carboxylesterase